MGCAIALPLNSIQITDNYLKNLVFIHLKNKYDKVWFYKTKQNHEVDFCIQVQDQIILYQVSYQIENHKTRQREIRSLDEAMKELHTSTAMIITYNQFETIETHTVPLKLYPFGILQLIQHQIQQVNKTKEFIIKNERSKKIKI